MIGVGIRCVPSDLVPNWEDISLRVEMLPHAHVA